MPSLAMDTKGQGRMIWEKLYLLRHVCFGVLFLIAGWSIVTESADTNTTAIARLGIHIASVSHQLDTLVSRLRIAALQRSTIMRDHEYRDQVSEMALACFSWLSNSDLNLVLDRAIGSGKMLKLKPRWPVVIR